METSGFSQGNPRSAGESNYHLHVPTSPRLTGACPAITDSLASMTLLSNKKGRSCASLATSNLHISWACTSPCQFQSVRTFIPDPSWAAKDLSKDCPTPCNKHLLFPSPQCQGLAFCPLGTWPGQRFHRNIPNRSKVFLLQLSCSVTGQQSLVFASWEVLLANSTLPIEN